MRKSDRQFIERFGQLIAQDQEMGVSHIRGYWQDGDDFVNITLIGGHAIQLRITGMKRNEILRTIVSAVCGD